MNYLFNKICLFIILISFLLAGCSSNIIIHNNTIVPDPVINIGHIYRTNQGSINIEIKNVTKEDIKRLQIKVSSEESNLIKEYKISSISAGSAKKISFTLDDKIYPKDLRIYVNGYYKKVSKNNLFICDYPLE